MSSGIIGALWFPKLISLLSVLTLFASCQQDVNLNISKVADRTPRFTISNAIANEGSNLTFNVSLTGSLSEVATVQYTTVNGSALAGSHFTSQTGILTFNPGEMTKTITVATSANASEICAPNRSLSVVLSSATGATILTNSSSGTIIDPDVPVISIAGGSATEGSTVSFTASLSAACPTKVVSFNWATSSGTATTVADYNAVNTTSSIAVGQTSIPLIVSTINDAIFENGTESFSATLSSATNATLGVSFGTGQIVDNDSMPVAQFSSSSQTLNEGGGSATINVTLSNPSVQTITIPFSITGTATGGGTDFTITSSPVTIAAGATSALITIALVDDAFVESSETVIVTMDAPTNATKTTPDAHTVTVTNNDVARISTVTSSVSNGTFTAGSVPIQVVFNSNVDVVGIPLLNLNTTPPRFASYASGTGTSTLIFNYALQSGDVSSDLDYLSVSSLVLSGGTIKDTIYAANAILTLAIPGTTGSLGFNKNIVINAPPIPVISSVTLPPDGISYEGDAIDFSMVFSEAVTVTGTPALALNIGGSSEIASYVSGSGTTTLVFRYTVRANITGDGPVLSSPLNLAGGTIKSGANVDATLTFTYPSTTGILIDGRTLTLSLDKNNVSLIESAGINQVFTLTLSQPSLIDLTIPLSVYGTALSLTDYDLATSSAFIPAGQTTVTVDFDVLDDSVDESRRYFTLFIERPSVRTNLVLGEIYASRVSILDDDPTKDRWLMISQEHSHSCGITTTGVLKCWGENLYSRLGDGTVIERLSPVVIDSGVLYKYISVSQNYSCGITTTDVLKCWGSNGVGTVINGTLGGTQATPAVVDSGTTYKMVTTSTGHICGITTADRIRCWGSNSDGQIGDGTTTHKMNPVNIDSLVTYKWISAKWDYTCAITMADQLKCWGDNTYGQLGDGTTTNRTLPVIISSGTSFKAVSTEHGHTCAINTSDTVYCWGSNPDGVLGTGSLVTPILTPSLVDSGVGYKSILTFWGGACGITISNVLKCWGYNYDGNLGDGTRVDKTLPTVADAGVTYKAISVGNYSCGITSSDRLKCWGYNDRGQYGNGEKTELNSPYIVDSGITYKSIDVGDYHICGITTSNVSKCWGYNDVGQLGDGSVISRENPSIVYSRLNFKQLSVGYGHTCGIMTNDLVKCWGSNYVGELGDGTTINNIKPVAVDGTTTYKFISAGSNHTCGITTADILKCWGSNNAGQLGDGTLINRLLPVIIDTGVTYKSVVTAFEATCAITTTNVLKCWGDNSLSKLGDGTTTGRTSPTVIDSGVGYKLVTMGSAHTCGITMSDIIKCWGYNYQGQLGDGTTVNKTTPVVADSGSTYIDMYTGGYFTCGVTSAGILKCWGMGGMLGDGTQADQPVPVVVDSGVSYQGIRAGENATCGLTTAGILKCWGSNYGGMIKPTTEIIPQMAADY